MIQMTNAQRLTLKSFIQADNVLGPKATAGDYDGVANGLNALASPDFWAWKTSVSQRDCVSLASADGTNWSWTIYIARSQGERDAWREMFADTGSVNPSRANVQSAIGDIFSGAGGAAQRTHLSAISRRKMTVAEKVLGTGTGSTASPATLGVVDANASIYCEGTVGAGDIGGILS